MKWWRTFESRTEWNETGCSRIVWKDRTLWLWNERTIEQSEMMNILEYFKIAWNYGEQEWNENMVELR